MTGWEATFFSKAVHDSLPELRRRVQSELEAHGIDAVRVANAGLLISELAHNAVDATASGKQVLVEVAHDDQGLRLTVECESNQDLESLEVALHASAVLPSPDSERGRGLWLVLNHSRHLKVVRGEDGQVRVSLVVKGDDA